MTGTSTITSVSGTGITPGTEITLIFDGVLTVTNGSNLRLASNFTTAATNTFTGRYISHPVGIASNETTAGRALKVTYTDATSVTFTTRGPSDVLGYACFKRD